MYDGNQVLRFESKYKASDLGGLGIELPQRKDTGNYDKDRTQFNYSFVPFTKPTFQEQVYSKLKDNKIYYNDGKNTNLLNSAIITSGKEFFQNLGMKFKESNRTHQVGKDKGKPILVPDIKSKEDIPEKVKKLEEKVNEIQETFNIFKEKMFNFCDKICRALGHKIGIHFSKNSEINYNDMEYYAKNINRKYEKDKSDDFEIGM